ncbi:hypothetical protein V5049_12090 [Moellerella wisconsensis]|uniref:hypothetical protein n=1 Tax=Moellerella wisconsensis TaxID=158849 RepID=UPI0030762A73
MELKPREVKLITKIIEYQCDSCGQGVMIFDRKCSSMQLTSPPQLAHVCNNCDAKEWLAGEYPKLTHSYAG